VGSGLIYAVIIVMWAAYFIPRWLRRHEELSESRSVEKFDHAMRILSRREKPVGDQRYIVMPPRPDAAPGDNRREFRRTSAPLPAQRTRPRRPAVSPVAMRRRRVLAALMMATLVTAVTVPLTPVPWWAPLLGIVAIVAFLVHCRLQARTRREVSRTRDAVRKRSRSRLLRFDAIERLMQVRREMAEERAAEEQRWLEAEQAEERLREEEAKRAAEKAAGWAPVPVPLPTYVNKPMAPRRVTVDLTRPGTWSEAQAAASGTAGPPEPRREQPDQPARRAPMSALLDDAADAEDQLDAIITPRAVND
jgi:hypothetical protein